MPCNPSKPKCNKMTAHDRACKSLLMGIKKIVSALSTYMNERNELDALGIFQEISSKRFLTTTLMLRDVFPAIQPLNLVLQKAAGWFTLSR